MQTNDTLLTFGADIWPALYRRKRHNV